MKNDHRFSSFFSRVDFEREVLQVVNRLPSLKAPLHGLHPAARTLWLGKQSQEIKASDLPALLEECWDHMGGMADHSRNVFEVKPAGQAAQRRLLLDLAKRLTELP